jgi:heme/copper-type cytochrome/quinol oxidase subunit 4
VLEHNVVVMIIPFSIINVIVHVKVFLNLNGKTAIWEAVEVKLGLNNCVPVC